MCDTLSQPAIADIRPMQEFRAELHAAEAKDKKFQKRKTVLKKIVANITMGNDSASQIVCFPVYRVHDRFSVTAIPRRCCLPRDTLTGDQEE